MTITNPPCQRCGELQDQHVGQHCLFMPTQFEAIDYFAVLAVVEYAQGEGDGAMGAVTEIAFEANAGSERWLVRFRRTTRSNFWGAYYPIYKIKEHLRKEGFACGPPE